MITGAYGGDSGHASSSGSFSLNIRSSNGGAVLLTFNGFDLDDFDNGVGQFQVFVNGQFVVDIPAGLNNLSRTGDFKPYMGTTLNFGPFDITGLLVQGQSTILFKDPSTSHFGLVRNVTIVRGSSILLHVRGAGAVFPGHPTIYTFSIPPLVISSFTASTTTPLVHQNVTLTATFTGGTVPFRCIFSFGDGESAVVAGVNGVCSVTHDYDYSGAFHARVTIRGASTSDLQVERLIVSVSSDPSSTTSFLVTMVDEF